MDWWCSPFGGIRNPIRISWSDWLTRCGWRELIKCIYGVKGRIKEFTSLVRMTWRICSVSVTFHVLQKMMPLGLIHKISVTGWDSIRICLSSSSTTIEKHHLSTFGADVLTLALWSPARTILYVAGYKFSSVEDLQLTGSSAHSWPEESFNSRQFSCLFSDQPPPPSIKMIKFNFCSAALRRNLLMDNGVVLQQKSHYSVAVLLSHTFNLQLHYYYHYCAARHPH